MPMPTSTSKRQRHLSSREGLQNDMRLALLTQVLLLRACIASNCANSRGLNGPRARSPPENRKEASKRGRDTLDWISLTLNIREERKL